MRSNKLIAGIVLALYFLMIRVSLAEEPLSLSGRLSLRGVQEFEKDSVNEDPSADGRIKVDGSAAGWRFHSWLEGGWDGGVRRPARDHALFKNYDTVYQSNTPFLEFKELYLAHTRGSLDIRAGIQRFAWGRLDEYPPNDLLNPWDYTRFLIKPLEDRKIGVPSLSATLNKGVSTFEAVWIPVFVPYRLPMPDERWAGASVASPLQHTPQGRIVPQEPVMPERTLQSGGIGVRVRRAGELEWSVNLFHGYDPRPVFRTTVLTITPQADGFAIDPGFTPAFHRITSAGFDAAIVKGDVSIRAEAAYAVNRYLNVRHELWGYPAALSPFISVYPLSIASEEKHDTFDYGIGADYRLFEDGLLTVQAQQAVIFGTVDWLYDRPVETILWANVKSGFMNQKIETNVAAAYNPEHGDRMLKVNASYIFSDAWKAGAAYRDLVGPAQSLFGGYSRNDQAEGELVFSW